MIGIKAHTAGIRKNVLKSAPIRPVTKDRPKRKYARIELQIAILILI